MSSPRFGRLHKAAALVPLALLSAAWTANIAGAGSQAAPQRDYSPTLPSDSLLVPENAIEAPASVSDGQQIDRRVDPGQAQRISSDSDLSGIPSIALAAYSRSEQVINSADASCHLPWELVAAIGRVESNHGSANGNQLDAEGIASPGIYGIPLNGANGTRAIADTDGGRYDNDLTWDRAVGPMQFIPSTWSAVAVDADGDTQRNPQDIQDAALGSAVYLCSGSEDLGTDAGRRSAVYRYNHSTSYVDLVLGVMENYMAGDFTTMPVSSYTSYSPGYSTTPYLPGNSSPSNGPGYTSPSSSPNGGDHGGGNGTNSPTVIPIGGPTSQPTSQPTGSPTTQPTGNPTTGPTSQPTSNPTGTPTGGPTPPPPGGDDDDNLVEEIVQTILPSPSPTQTQTPPPSQTPTSDPVEDTLTRAEALAQCIAQGVVDRPLTAVDEREQCVRNLLG